MHIDKIEFPESLESEDFFCHPVSDQYKDQVHSILKNVTLRNNILSPVIKDRELFEKWWSNRKDSVESGKLLQWCAFHKESGNFVALLTIKEINTDTHRAEVGYSLLPEYWRKGYGFQLVKTMVDYAFEKIAFHSLFAQILTTNIGSQKIVSKLGFIKEGHFKDFHFYENAYHDLLQYGMLNPADK